jgi:hypothetical protein
VTNALLLSVPLVVFVLVVLFGFAGCWLDTEGKGGPAPDVPEGGGPWEGGPPPPNYNEFILQSGPIAWWPLTDPDGAPVAMDKVGPDPGNHPGTYVGSVIRGQAAGQSLDDSDPFNTPTRFDGTGSIEVAHNDSAFELTEFSVEALVLPDNVAPEPSGSGGAAVDSYIVRNFSSSGGWALLVVPNAAPGIGGLFVARIWDSGGSPTSVELPYHLDAPMGSAWWVLMRFVGGALWLRVDDVVDGKNGSYSPNTTDPLQIGVDFYGALQHVAVYDRALGEQEAVDHMQGSKTPLPGP